LQGDNNTNFFHRIANGKRRKNKILSLINNDVVIEEENLLVEHAMDYYKKLFGPPDSPPF